MPVEQARQAAQGAWQRTCLHVEGLAVASTVAGFGRLGLFDRLNNEPCSPDAALSGMSTGYAAVGLRLLEHLGWFDQGALAAGRYTLSPAGSAGCISWRFYQDLPADMGRDEDLPPTAGYTDGFRAAPALLRLHDALPAAGHTAGSDVGGMLTEGERRLLAARGLVAQGSGQLTLEGGYAVAFAPQCRHVLSYAALMARVPALLAGADVFVPDPVDHEETHLDRAADIRFSGEVYAASCAPGVASMARRIAMERPFRYLIDIGAGDGTMLLALYHTLAPMLPGLLVVAVEPSGVARAQLSQRLMGAGVAHLVLDGDVADPAGIRAALLAHGIGLDESLVTMKSVLHDRALRIACPSNFAGLRAQRSSNRFVAAGGVPAMAGWVEADLIACLAEWRTVLGPAGMLLVEAHTAAPIGPPERAILVALDATHGYSHQYLLEADVHLDCCVAAGFDVSWVPINRQLGFVALSAAWLTDPHDSPPSLRRG